MKNVFEKTHEKDSEKVIHFLRNFIGISNQPKIHYLTPPQQQDNFSCGFLMIINVVFTLNHIIDMTNRTNIDLMCQYDYDLEFMKGFKRVLSIHLCQLTLKKGRDLDVEMIEFLKNKRIVGE